MSKLYQTTITVDLWKVMPLNKNLGLRLIGVGAVLRMILEKIVMMISKQNVVKASGSLEFCAG